MTSARLHVALVFSALFAGCGAPPSSRPDDPTRAAALHSEPDYPDVVFSANAHLMPMRSAVQAERLVRPEASGAHLTYYGGPVLSNVEVVTVFWGNNVAGTSHINSFYGSVTNSNYFDWLSEYNTKKQKIGRGSFAGTLTIASPPGGKNVTDAGIQKELASLLSSGKLKNDANRLFAVHFAPGYNITAADGSQSCVEFCAYHSTFSKGGSNVYYSVIPDLGPSSACATGCGAWPQAQDNTTEVASHELVEATTDAAVGLATSLGSPLAWYDQVNGEIGDICNGQGARINGYAVQLEWSNQAGNCIAHK
jgi:hypothetical protein